jgi:hypothetical protein
VQMVVTGRGSYRRALHHVLTTGRLGARCGSAGTTKSCGAYLGGFGRPRKRSGHMVFTTASRGSDGLVGAALR